MSSIVPSKIQYRAAAIQYEPTLGEKEQNVANWIGSRAGLSANGYSGIFSPTYSTYPWPEVIAEFGEPALTMMTIDTREQRTGRRSTSTLPTSSPGEVAGSLTGELAYNIRDSIPGNVVRSKPLLRKRQPFWYLDLVRHQCTRKGHPYHTTETP